MRELLMVPLWMQGNIGKGRWGRDRRSLKSHCRGAGSPVCPGRQPLKENKKDGQEAINRLSSGRQLASAKAALSPQGPGQGTGLGMLRPILCVRSQEDRELLGSRTSLSAKTGGRK